MKKSSEFYEEVCRKNLERVDKFTAGFDDTVYKKFHLYYLLVRTITGAILCVASAITEHN